jgi:RHS repeat-associated protein
MSYLIKRLLIVKRLLIAVCAISVLGFAQLAPTGQHYAGRRSDTGFGGTRVDATGAVAAAIPLDLPPARGGLPIPLKVIYGTRSVGAAGLGWDVPLSYVQQYSTLAHRRPFPPPSGSFRERTYFSLFGQTAELILDGNTRNGRKWVATSGTLEFAVLEIGSAWFAYDGQGRTYTFKRPAALGVTGLWLLASVSDTSGSSVALSYQISNDSLNGSVRTAIDLVSIAYNQELPTISVAPGCPKNVITLAYYPDAATPLSMSVLDDRILLRKHVLHFIDVQSHATCLLGSPLQRLRRYAFQYNDDPDTKLPRLQSVQMFGRQGTPEENAALPVGSYSYGSALNNGKLQYETTQTIDIPEHAAVDQISGTASDDSDWVKPPGDQDHGYAMWQTLIDLTGDGRPDLVFKQQDANHNDKLFVAYNFPAADGSTTIAAGTQLSDSTFANGGLSAHTLTQTRYGYSLHNTTNVWREAIDVNGDGRIDVIDAREEPDRWVVYLNTPGPTGIKWVRRSFSVANLRTALLGFQHKIDGPYLPLSRRATGVDTQGSECWQWEPPSQGKKGKWQACNDFHNGDNEVPEPGKPENTYIEWDLMDLNGDGYPDFVFNTAPVQLQIRSPKDPPQNPSEPFRRFTKVVNHTFAPGRLDDPYPMNDVLAAFNAVGVRFDTDHDAFLPPEFLRFEDPGVTFQFGVGLWQEATVPFGPEGVQQQLAGFADVNGDGLLDRVVRQNVYLGVYRGTRSRLGAGTTFASSGITLPGPLATVRNTYKKACAFPRTKQPPQSDQTQGLRDLTGDGIPDYYESANDQFNFPHVWIGTGTGFRPDPVPITSDRNIVFSHQTEECGDTFSNTDGGLYDIDGDGKPEIIFLNPDPAGRPAMFVSQLSGGQGLGRPEAGRLTSIDNGYGARTDITYVSAKQHTDNHVPFPEIVVSSVATTGTQGLGGRLAGTEYAYGDAELVFDSALDRFTFPGYERLIELRLFGAQEPGPAGSVPTAGDAIITDAWPLTPLCTTFPDCTGLTKQERWLRIKQVGSVRDVLTVRGLPNPDPSHPPDPWALLNVKEKDPRVIGATHYNYDAKLYELPPSSTENSSECFEMVDPLDYSSSLKSNSDPLIDVCRFHGFAFVASTGSWFGDAAPPSNRNIQTATRTLRVDDFGHPTIIEYDNDLFRKDDDICIENTFANPNGTFPRVLNALASRRFYACGKDVNLASESWRYDGLPAGSVSNGRVTSHDVDRWVTDTGSLLNRNGMSTTVHKFDATYDSAGNLRTVRTQRDTDARIVTFAYDSFGLGPVHTTIDASGIPSVDVAVTFDPISLQPISSTDTNQMTRGTDYDGFGRPVRGTVTPPGGTLGALSTMSYLGFSGSDSAGRRITVTQFPDPVAPASVGTTPGRSGTLFLDELGRRRRSELALGSDYANQVLVVGSRSYDGAGRVIFEAYPYPSTQDPSTAYGTSYYFDNRGDLNCIIRGQGHQALTTLTDLASERLPTCFQRSFAGHVYTLDTRDAASLLAPSFGLAQSGVVKRTVATAIGRVIERSTLLGDGGTRVEDATFAYDRLGQLTSMTRFLEPAGANLGTQWSFQLDSMGETLQMAEPDSATRSYSYSDWGEPVETQWVDAGIDRRLVRTYDAMGRLIATEERNNGVTDPDTVNTYAYDTGVNVSPLVTPTFVLGQLARATSPGGQVTFSYDAFGAINAKVFTDNQGGIYIEKAHSHADGSLGSLAFHLPDRSYDQELVTYGYDSAGGLRQMDFADASGNFQLYRADDIDVLGRVRRALYPGNTVFHATYANAGRQLIQEEGIASPLGSRQILFGRFDPVGRELSRQEITDGAASGPQTLISYDALGRMQTAKQTNGTTTLFDRTFSYDAIGNILKLADNTNTADNVLLSDQVNDRDRLCRIDDGLIGPPPAVLCNVTHDALGNVITEPTPTGSRQFTYFLTGNTRTITEQGTQARFAYDAFGGVQALDIQGTPTQERHERRYGGLIERHDAPPFDGTTSFVTRYIPGPQGILAGRHGSGNDWVFEFGELRGNRFFTNQSGAFVQEVDYQPFGTAKSQGAAPNAASYTNAQWNGGDALAAFDLFQLGARIYDPRVGRFLSRDPLVLPRSAGSSNPYAFAANDPVNGADPTGLDDWSGGYCTAPEQCSQTPITPFSPSGGGGASPTAGPGTPRPVLHPLPEPLFPGGPTTAEGAAYYFLALDRYGTELPKRFNFSTYAATGASFSALLDALEQTAPIALKRDAEVDAHNARLDRIAGYSRIAGISAIGFVTGTLGATIVTEVVAPAVVTGLVGTGTAEVVATGTGGEVVGETVATQAGATEETASTLPQYYIENGVRRCVACQQAGLTQIPATIYQAGQAPVNTTLNLNQLFSPKTELLLNQRFLNIQPPIQVPIQVQPLGLPGQLPTVPLNQVRLVPPEGGG